MKGSETTSNLLVVCYGNICRSPMAEGLLRRRLPHCAVSSAGTNAVGGDRAASHAIAAMERVVGIDISGHRSSPMTVDTILAADHILTMSMLQARLAAAFAPEASARIRLLGSFAPGHARSLAADPDSGPASPLEIGDPIGRSLDDFVDCLDRISRSVQQFARWLENGADPAAGPPAVGSARWPQRVGV